MGKNWNLSSYIMNVIKILLNELYDKIFNNILILSEMLYFKSLIIYHAKRMKWLKVFLRGFQWWYIIVKKGIPSEKQIDSARLKNPQGFCRVYSSLICLGKAELGIQRWKERSDSLGSRKKTLHLELRKCRRFHWAEKETFQFSDTGCTLR